MKKIFILSLSVIALLAFAATAFALHGTVEKLDYTPSLMKAKSAQIEIGGHMRIRGSFCDNCSDFRDTETIASEDAFDDQNSSYDQRIRLNVKATVSPNTMGFLELENEAGGSDGTTWGATGAGSGIYSGHGNSKNSDMQIRQAYIAHQGNGLGVFSGWKAGHMLIKLGNGMFYNHTKGGDDGLVFWIQPADQTEIALAILKLTEGSSILSDDTDVYAVTFETAMSGVSLSGDVAYLNDNNETLGATDKGIDLINIAVRADADLGGVNIYGDIDFQTGEVSEFKANGDDMDLSGFAVRVGAEAKLGEIGIHGEFAYGSGDDIDEEDEYSGFVTSISSGGDIGTFVYDNTVATAAQNGFSTSAAMSSSYAGASSTNGLANTTVFNVGLDAKVHPDVKVNGELFYLLASEEVADDTIEGQDEQDIGLELDAKVTYQIDTNLAYYIETGILFAGDFYSNVTGDKDEVADPWRIRHGIVLSF
jgi:hypothetical protein